MIRYQLTYLIQRRDFRFSFFLMMFLACGYPVYLIYTKLMEGADIGTVCDQRYAYMFYSYSDLMYYIPYIFPIISLFPAAISFNIDRNSNYYNIIVSKCGIRKYLFSYATIAFLGGFFMMIFPLLVSIFFSYTMFPHTNQELLYGSLYEDVYDWPLNYSSYSFLQLLWYQYPILSDLYSALRASVCMSVFSLVTYVTSVFIKPKYTFMSIIPVCLIVFSGRYLANILDREIDSIDFLHKIGSVEFSGGSILFFWSTLAILTGISFAVLHLFTKKDMIKCMTTYHKKTFWKAIWILLFFILYAIAEKINMSIQMNNSDGLSEFMIAYFGLELEYRYTDISSVIYHFFPVLVFLFLFGIQLYDDWRTEKIYIMIRYQSRSQYYIKRIRTLLLESMCYTILHEMVILFLYFSNVSLQLHSLNFAYLMTWFLLETTLLFVLSIAMSLISLRFGASYGLFSIVILFIFGIKLSLFILSHHAFMSKIGCFGIWQLNILYFIKNKTLSMYQWFAIPFHILSICIFGKYWIQHYDVGLGDKEQE